MTDNSLDAKQARRLKGRELFQASEMKLCGGCTSKHGRESVRRVDGDEVSLVRFTTSLQVMTMRGWQEEEVGGDAQPRIDALTCAKCRSVASKAGAAVPKAQSRFWSRSSAVQWMDCVRRGNGVTRFGRGQRWDGGKGAKREGSAMGLRATSTRCYTVQHSTAK